MSKRLPNLLAGLAVVLTTVAGSAAASADLVSHRAFYEMSLLSARFGSDIAALKGKMVLQVVDTCDGWTLDQRITLKIYDPKGRELNSYITFASWESKDGSRFSFRQQTRFGDHLVEESSGRAEREPRPRVVRCPVRRGGCRSCRPWSVSPLVVGWALV